MFFTPASQWVWDRQVGRLTASGVAMAKLYQQLKGHRALLLTQQRAQSHLGSQVGGGACGVGVGWDGIGVDQNPSRRR